MPREFTRPEKGFEFTFGGFKSNERADSMPPNKFPLAVNVRSYARNQVRTRPGIVTQFNTGANKVTDMRAYTTIFTDNAPRMLVRDTIDNIWLDTGVQVGSLSGGGSTLGAVFIPFRPNQSPNSYMYIANGVDYQKFSAPNASNLVIQQKVGIAEPQAPPDAGINNYVVSLFTGAWVWTQAGTAGAVATANRVNDAITVRVPDPVNRVYTLQVPSATSYQIGMSVIFGFSGGGSVQSTVIDVFTAMPTAMNISAIYYFSGTTGHCLILSSSVGSNPGLGLSPVGAPLLLSSLRRGALLLIGAEIVYVWSVTPGPDGTVCIETSTVGAYTTANTFTAPPAIQTVVQPGGGVNPINAVSDVSYLSTVTAGIGTITATVGNPFINAGLPLRPEDYITFGLKIDSLANLTEMKFLIDVGDGSFTQNFYYYTVRPADITAAVLNTATQLAASQTIAQRAIIDEMNAINLANEGGVTFSGEQSIPGASQWTQILFPLSSLTRVGSDKTKSLQTISKVQILVNASGTVNMAVDAPVVVGGFAPDVGDAGAPYYYRIRPRSSVTGVVGNPSPAMRYGVNPRRMPVKVILPFTYSDPQVDTWDVFRMGGAVETFRFVGQAPIGTGIFTDVYDDDAVNEGDALEFDNFEPWPSVDVPLNDVFATVVGTTATYVRPIIGTSTQQLARILNYLPGTLIRIGGQNVYTLWVRPTLIATDATNYTFLFQFLENAGNVVSNSFQINEPLLARQAVPYMWGPDVNGTIFAAGDPLRPGTLYFSKGNNPDSAPDKYNIEICSPSEPLLGGEVLDGLSYVASSKRWWALYPQPGNPEQRYNFVEQPLTRGIIAPFGHCNNGIAIFWWAKDGIYSSQDGSLTDEDLYTLFPHEGVVPEPYSYNGVTIFPPDYAQAPKFRLAYANGYLYATYPYIGGNGQFSPVLVCDLRTKAWSVDIYGGTNGINAVYEVEQPSESNNAFNPVILMAGTQQSGISSFAARIFKQQDLLNDNGVPIGGFLATFEFDGQDKRAPKQWGDMFLDCRPAATASGGISVTPMSEGSPVAPLVLVPTSSTRVRVPLSVGGIVVSDFLGTFYTWSDDFTHQSNGTRFYLWQPSFLIQPAQDISWSSFGTSFGLKGYIHLRQIDLAWVSTAPIIISCLTFDGMDPLPITIPSSNGNYQKAVFPFSANKGLLFSFTISSAQEFQIFNDDSELYVGQWNRQEPYTVFRGFGGSVVADAPI